MKKAVTLTEFIMVVVIISILASWGLAYFSVSREKAADKEAIYNLKLMQAAEKSYKLDAASYYPTSGSPITDISLINLNLRLSLTTAGQRNWNYTVYSTGCVQATRNGGDGRSWYFRITDGGGAGSDCNADGQPNTNSCYTCP